MNLGKELLKMRIWRSTGHLARKLGVSHSLLAMTSSRLVTRGLAVCDDVRRIRGRSGRPYRVFVAVLKDKIPQQEEVNSFAVNLGDHPLSRDREPRHPGWGCGHDGVDGVVGSLGLGVLNQGHQLIVNREQNRDA